MRLGELVDVPLTPPAADVEITGLAFDNRAVEPGTLFFCVPGFTRDGHDYAADAIARGAAALVVERELDVDVPQVRVPSARAAMAPVAARFCGDPTARLTVVGVTGTNGKTTSCFLIRELLEAGGIPTALLGTVKSVVGGREAPLERTTPEAIELQRAFAAMLDAGDRACAMEVSSHALELHRVDAIHWSVAVFTNLYREHLDWHGSAERYAADKLRLARLEEVETVVANARDPRLAGLFELPKRVLAFGRAPGFEPSAEGIVREGATVIPAERVPLLGTHNLLNVCAALAALEALGVELPDPAAALEDFEPLPHRLEPVAGTPGPALWVNDSISTTPESTMAALEAFRGRPLIVIAGGFDRRQDYGELGRALAESARVVIGVPDTGGRIVQAVREAGASDCRTYEAADLAEAVAIAARHAGPDSVVLLSPAAPSFGAYRDFEARGRHFRELALASGG